MALLAGGLPGFDQGCCFGGVSLFRWLSGSNERSTAQGICARLVVGSPVTRLVAQQQRIRSESWGTSEHE